MRVAALYDVHGNLAAPGAFSTLLGPEVQPCRTRYDVECALDVLGPAAFPSFQDVFPRAPRGLVAPEEAAASFESRRGS